MTQAMRMLLAEGVISRDELERALTQKAARGGSASQHLVEAGAIGSEELARFMARRFPLPRWPRQRIALVPPLVLGAIPATLARSLRVLPVALREGALTVAIVDPTEGHALEETARAAGIAIETVLVSEADMTFALEQHYGRERAPIAPHEEVPLPLTRRVTRRMSVVSEDHAEPAPQPTGGTIAEALDAIPLVRRVTAVPTAPQVPAAAPAPPAARSAPRPDYDSWHIGPAPAGPPAPAEPDDGPPEVAAPSPSRSLSEGEIIAAIGEAADRDAVVALAIDYLRRFASRAAFFTVKRDEIRGFDIVDELGHRDAARSFWIPLAAPSTLRRVAEDRHVYTGSLDRTSADAVLAAALGGRPERVIVAPIALKGKTVGLLMADGFSAAAPPRTRLEHLCEAVAEAFTRFIARGRER